MVAIAIRKTTVNVRWKRNSLAHRRIIMLVNSRKAFNFQPLTYWFHVITSYIKLKIAKASWLDKTR